MFATMIFSLIFFAISIIMLISGLLALRSNHKTPANRLFFILTIAIVIWLSGMAVSYITSDNVTSEIFWRASAIGRNALFAILLHLILIISGKYTLLKKPWFYVCLYLPALFSIFTFTVPSTVIPVPYVLQKTEFGWINIAHGNMWDRIFYFYYFSYILIGLLLLYRWCEKLSDNYQKKTSYIILLSLFSVLIIGTIADILFKIKFPDIPQLVPIISFIPILTIYNVIQKDMFNITEDMNKKISYMILIINALIHIFLSTVQALLSNINFTIGSVTIPESVLKGTILQIQMLISVYMVLRESRLGYNLAFIINSINLSVLLIWVVKTGYLNPLPGIVSHTGVLLIIALIKKYKVKYDASNKRIDILNKKLAFDEALYHNVFDQAPVGIAIMNDKTHANQPEFGGIAINPKYKEILNRDENELRNLTWMDITHPDDVKADLEKFEHFKKGEISGYTMEKRFIKPDDSVVYTRMSISPLSGIYDDNAMHICLIEDITERKLAELALKESEHRESVILSHLPGLAYRCNYDGEWTMQYVSEGCYNLTGYSADSLLHNKEVSFNDIIAPEYRQTLKNEWNRVLTKRQPFKYEYEIITATGERKWVLEMGQGIYANDCRVEALEGIVLDISDRKKIEDRLRYISEHDKLTDLYNREFLESLLHKDLKKNDGLKRALIGINLSTVQLLTANYGFHYTQNIIKNAAELLKQLASDRCQLFQTYESRFVFYLTDYKDKNELVDFSEAIAQIMEPLFIAERIIAGIAILEIEQDENENSVDSLLQKLLITSENSIKLIEKHCCVCFYDEKQIALINRENSIRQSLLAIVANDSSAELFLQYQPFFDLKTNTISGFEALARLRTDELGLVTPEEFIPIAEKTKLIIPIGEIIILKALHMLNKLREHGYDNISVSINISAVQLLQPDFTCRLLELINKMKVNPKNIGIEITETIFSSDYERINSILEKLRDYGFHIAIDDFGIGYSSLAREKELKVDCLKIDKYFIKNLLFSDLDKAIIGDIISMAHKLGQIAIAEGIEHVCQLQYLKEHDCDKIQGYLISKPLDEYDVIKFLETHYMFDCSSDIIIY